MYIWIAIDVDDQLSSIRKEAKRIEDMVQFAESDITLPMHISLKISCSIPNEKYEEAVRDIKALLQDAQRFEIKTKRIELHDTIAWIQMEHNEYLEQLHHSLDQLLLDKYNVPPHKFDLDFKFHTTLFLDSDADKVKQAFLMIKDVSLPSTLIADKFVIGASPEGKIGTYKVTEEIKNNTRCSWCNLKNETYIKYHDKEWGKPLYDDKKLYELLILECFQAGLSWECILNKRENFREAFDHFDIDKVMQYDEEKLEELLNNPGIIRNRLKVKAAVKNSLVFHDIQKEYGSFSEYIWGFTEGKVVVEPFTERTTSPLSDAISKDLKKRGMTFVGSTIIYSFLQSMGIINGHSEECMCYHK